MSLFVDKYYEKLDFLSQAVEPYYHPIMDEFANLPDRIEFTQKELDSCVTHSNYYNTYSFDEYKLTQVVDSKIDSLLHKLTEQHGITDISSIKKELYQVDPNCGFEFDHHDGTVKGTFSIIKMEGTKVVDQEFAKRQIMNAFDFQHMNYRQHYLSKSQMMNILHLFEVSEEKLKSISQYNGRQLFYNVCDALYSVLIKDSKYRIRGLDAAQKINRNIRNAFGNADMQVRDKSMANLTLFKIVLNKGTAVYQLEEIP